VVDDLGRWREMLQAIAGDLEHEFAISHITLQPEDIRQPVVWAAPDAEERNP
jgi:hypothetical protein